MKKTLTPLLAMLLTAILFISTAQAVEYDRGMSKKEVQATLENAVLDFEYECFYICGGKKFPVTQDSKGNWYTSDNVFIPSADVDCIGKLPVDKVARIKRTADQALALAKAEKGAKATANEARTISKKAQATADEAIGRLDAMVNEQGACLDSVRLLRDELTLMITSRYTTLNNSYVSLNSLFEKLKLDMPADQSAAVDSLQENVSTLEDWVEVLKALGWSTHAHKLDKIIAKAQAVDPHTKVIKRRAKR